MNYRILIADDHPLARMAIRNVLESDPRIIVAGEAENGEEAVRLAGQLHPDLILMDIHMPICDGLEATRRIKERNRDAKIIMLSVSDDVADLFTAIQFGAQGYLLKNMEPEDWLNYIQALLEGKTDVPRELAGRLFYQFRPAPHDEPLPSVLTPREREIVRFVAAGATNRHIAEQLKITENTVKNHMKNILEKLFLDNRVQLAAYAIRHGITDAGREGT